MTAEQAARLMFPQADAIEALNLALDPGLLQQLQAQGLRARSAVWSIRVARRQGAVLGYVVDDEVIGKFELIGFAVGIEPEGRVRQVEILSYRESHGHEVQLPAWRKQFVGKGPADLLRVGEDIANLSGATLSCTHVTEGVRRAVLGIAALRRGGRLA
jgi:Na+-translocating ferredoxin:NAD+ oxidoreductase RnfG subunit